MMFFHLAMPLLLVVHVEGLEIPTTIKTSLGHLLGVKYTEPYTKKTVYEFRKIPYAIPPVGKSRFTNPWFYGRWLGTLTATKFGPSCYQDIEMSTAFLSNTNISENCLHLNIYVPNNISRRNDYSVMVWIHGGKFDKGQGMTFRGGMLASIGDVIVVTVNYRLGIFGFLSTGDSAARGNYGFKDQQIALLWIRRYIKSFGGNPKSITVFGHSAGAMSIALHALMTKGLFRRMILQSGFATSPLSLSTSVPKYTKKVAKLVRCWNNDNNLVVDCLRNITSKDLQSAYRDVISKIDHPTLSPPFGPVIDGKRITDNPSNLLRNSTNFNSIDLLIGNVVNEGSTYVELLNKYQKSYNFNISNDIPKRILCNHIAPLLAKDIYSNNQELSQAICNRYGNGSDLQEQTSNQLDFYGDVMFNIQTKRALTSHSEGNSSSKTFQYMFAQHTDLTQTKILPSWVKGPVHGSDIYFVSPFLELMSLSDDNKKVVEAVMKYWTNFAKYGDVNGDDLAPWPEYDPTHQKYLQIDVNMTSRSKLYESRVDFWLEEVPNLPKLGVTVENLSSSISACTVLVFSFSLVLLFSL
ncbi:liver carboxylesterase 1-like [Mytilus edulis]|uniref:liver carboxylesterase 1-like n=1 Tax=Mytilus edulis TaxID=6550 RepID=UPI0039EF1D9C